MVFIMQMKSWESPRRGRQRNTKSQQASARLRQLKKRNQQLRQRLKSNNTQSSKTPGSLPGVFAIINTLV
jgi:cell shape-determining protein MreC